ncbi:unnamed protein product [Moneuplotes crassus]|uniref:Uncharacterized protein n=1 Tax=Euplotes crassus TaxID=5936 RepID=A0AAD1U276_EUPCR|nr:unnamed protein product [Moneuplotes crassus]
MSIEVNEDSPGSEEKEEQTPDKDIRGYQRRLKKRLNKGSCNRPKSNRLVLNGVKGQIRIPTINNFHAQRNSNGNEERLFNKTPDRSKDFLAKIQSLIKNYGGKESIARSASMFRVPKKTLFNNNARVTIDAKTNEVKRIKPRRPKLDKEKLYDQVIEYKNLMNEYKDENIRLKTKLKQLEKEQVNNEILTEEIKQAPQFVGKIGKTMTRQRETLFVLALKKQVAEQKNILRQKDTEIEKLKKNYKHTRITELEIDQKVYIEELMRMRAILEEVLKSKESPANTECPKNQLNSDTIQDNKLKNAKKENKELTTIIKSKEKQIIDQSEKLKERDTRIEKLKASVKDKNKLKQQHKEKNKELIKIRNELTLLKTKTDTKGVQNTDIVMRSSTERQKDQIITKNKEIDSLRQEKKILTNKVNSLTKKLANTDDNFDEIYQKLQEETNQRKYYEELYQEEREKNIDLNSQSPKRTTSGKDPDIIKNSRPQVASIHGRGKTSNKRLEEVKENIFEDTSNKSQKHMIEDGQEKLPKNQNPPIRLKSITAIALSMRLHISKMEIEDLKEIFPETSFTLESLRLKVKELFRLEDEQALKISRYIFEKDEPILNGAVKFDENKSMSSTEVISIVETLCTKGINCNFPLFQKEDPKIIEKSISLKIQKTKISAIDLLEEILSSCKIDDEDHSGYLSASKVKQIIEFQDLDLTPIELLLLLQKFFVPTRSGLDNLHYPSFAQCLDRLPTKHSSQAAIIKIQEEEEPLETDRRRKEEGIEKSEVEDEGLDELEEEVVRGKGEGMSGDHEDENSEGGLKGERIREVGSEECGREICPQVENTEESADLKVFTPKSFGDEPKEVFKHKESENSEVEYEEFSPDENKEKSSTKEAHQDASQELKKKDKVTNQEDLFPKNESEKYINDSQHIQESEKSEKELQKEASQKDINDKEASNKAMNHSEDTSPKKHKKNLDMSKFRPLSLKIIADLTTYISQNPDANLFGDKVFIQTIKSKNKQTDVYLIEAEHFFEVLELFGIVSVPFNPVHKEELQKAKENLQEILCIDLTYKTLLMIKKVNLTVSQLSSDTELLEKAKSYQYPSVNPPSPIQVHNDSDSEEEKNIYEKEFESEEKVKRLNSSSSDLRKSHKNDEVLSPKDSKYESSFNEAKDGKSLKKSHPSDKKEVKQEEAFEKADLAGQSSQKLDSKAPEPSKESNEILKSVQEHEKPLKFDDSHEDELSSPREVVEGPPDGIAKD